MTAALVLSGGANLGAAQVGMMMALQETGVRPDLVIGTSVGALNGAWIAADAPLDELGDLWRSLRPVHRQTSGGVVVDAMVVRTSTSECRVRWTGHRSAISSSRRRCSASRSPVSSITRSMRSSPRRSGTTPAPRRTTCCHVIEELLADPERARGQADLGLAAATRQSPPSSSEIKRW